MILSAEVATTLGRLRLTFEPVIEDGQPVAVGRIATALLRANAAAAMLDVGLAADQWFPIVRTFAADLIAQEGLQTAILEAGE